jgi:metallo-beta-lactamase class B
MFASILLLATGQLGPSITVPLQQPPPQVERPIAPIETAGPAYDAACGGSHEWEKPAPPVRIFGNTYFVGTCGISSILITSKQGHILIDGGTEADGSLIAHNIQNLGFRLSDVKIILQSHEHFDHVGGVARLQQLTGAQVFASPAAAAVLRTGAAGKDDPQAGLSKPFPAARVDHVIQDGEMVRVGDSIVIAVATPGHTPGALTWHWGSCDGGICRQIVYADSLTPVSRDDYRFSDHAAYLQAYRASFAKVAALDCDILITPHPSSSGMPDRLAGRAPLEDRDACRNYAAFLSKKLDERLAKEATGH